MTFIPVNIKEAETLWWWRLVLEGLDKLMATNWGEESVEHVLENLRTKVLFLYIIFDNDNKYAGFFTVKKFLGTFKNEEAGSLIVNHTYRPDKKFNRQDSLAVEAYIEQLANEADCKFIRTYTRRKAERYAQMLGYTPVYTEYIKSLTGETL